MHQGWLLIGLSLAYLGLLFLIAYVADKNKRRRPKGQPLLYSLSLAVYCTSWTFFGTVGQASESPWSPVPIYLGPMLVFLFGWRLLARLILVAKREHITSIADFIAARYGKSQRLAMVISLIAIMGILPYLVLQLKAIVTGLDLLMANSVPAGPTGNTAELALGALQRLKVQPPKGLARMRGRGFARTDYREQPRWLQAVAALRAAQLID